MNPLICGPAGAVAVDALAIPVASVAGQFLQGSRRGRPGRLAVSILGGSAGRDSPPGGTTPGPALARRALAQPGPAPGRHWPRQALPPAGASGRVVRAGRL